MKALAALLPPLFVAALATAGALALVRFGLFGWTLFVVAPLFAGALSALMFPTESAGAAAVRGVLTVTAGLTLFLLLGIEGLICIAMALPLAVPLGALGACAVHWMYQLSRPGRLVPLLLLPPAGVVYDVNAQAPLFEVRTSVEIKAPARQVWRHVVAFAELPEPGEWFFRAGLAYPKRARIEGAGVGAVRYCDFSTGSFVEPIVVWDEPRLLQFRVTGNPPPMHELSPWGGRVRPKHLDGYMVSERGQFHLTALPGGRTLLEGTTWYRHGLWPAEYWRWWSDAVIHRIHLRVLKHIRVLSESADGP
jgi:hypothetical protein